jgi:hypothetical protein
MVIKHSRLGPEVHGPLDFTEAAEVADMVVGSSQFKEAVAKLELPENTEYVVEPWMFGRS